MRVPSNPRFLLQFDAAGAAASAALLGVVLPLFQPAFGMPTNTLYVLACVPVLFFAYDVACLRLGRTNSRALLPIALANFSYCALSSAALALHHALLTPLGWAYFLGELVIVAVLAAVELLAWRGGDAG